MEAPSQADLVCLYLATAEGDSAADGPASPTAADSQGETVQAISDALDLDRGSTTQRVSVLSTLDELRADGLLTGEEVSDGGTTRTRFHLTERGRRHARRLRERLEDRRVTVTNGTTEEVPVTRLDQYFDGASLVRALARLTDDGTIHLREDIGGEFVDREAELARLREALAAVTRKGGRTVLVSGAAGLGKTSLVERLLEDAREEGFRVATGRCRRSDDRPYGPLLAAFRNLPDSDGLVEPLATAAAVEPDDPDDYETRRTALFDDVADALREQAGDRPLVVFLDDLQWAGADTRDLFAHLTGTVTEFIYPVLFVATYRTGAAATDDALDATIRDLVAADRTEHLELEPLPAADSHGLVAWLTGRPDLSDTFLDALRERTGGNPLLLRATAQQLVDRGVLDPEGDGEDLPDDPDEWPVPEDVTSLVETRLAALPERTRAVLEAAAVAGETVAPRVVASVLEDDEATVNDHLDVLATGGFLERTADGVAFVGGLVREAIVDQLSGDRRRALHAATAESLRTVSPDAVENRAARIAHHYERAGDEAAAIEHYRLAGDRAREVYANEEAIETYERALSLGRDTGAVDSRVLASIVADLADVYSTTGAFDEARERAEEGLELAPEDSREQCRLLGRLADVLHTQGEYDRARDAAERQRDLATALDAPEFEAEAFAELGRVANARGEYDRAREYHEESLELARGTDDRETANRALVRLGGVVWRQSEYDRARDYFERALELARGRGDRLKVAACHNNLGLVAWRQGEYDRAARALEESLDIKREIGDRHGVANTLENLGLIARTRDDHEGAREYHEESLDLARELGDRQGEATSLHSLGQIARFRGEYDRAREYHEESLELARELGVRQTEANNLNGLGEVARVRGEYDRARERYEEYRDIASEIGDRLGEIVSQRHLAQVAIRRGDDDRAEDLAGKALDLAREIDDAEEIAETLIPLGRVALRRRDYGTAREHLEEALATARNIEHSELEGRALHFLGALARADGDHEAASDRLDRALELAETAGTPLVTAEIRLTAARLSLARDALEPARDRVRRAHETADSLGATHLAGKARLLLGRVAAESGDDDAAREHWACALETFESVGAPQDSLRTLRFLVETCGECADEGRVREWRSQARNLLSEAPDPIADRHREWVREHATADEE